jgi:hypothetical protein
MTIKVFVLAQWMVEESRAEKIAHTQGLSEDEKTKLVFLFMERPHSIWGVYSSPDSYEIAT